ncbi:MAG: hydroxyacid dehydrogenase [Pedosphaera sp.]|nr:hydroxyacid dehydrogenase [Pedosphaera sp.]MSU42819.1 hydroxyacid dehydrogenase [Pedosphaera sp.]
MSWKILATASTIQGVGTAAADALRAAGCAVTCSTPFGPLNAESLRAQLTDADAVFASSDDYNAAVLTSPTAAKVKIISRWGVGYDCIHLPSATAQGIVVTYTPGLLDDAVADYTFALLLGVARRIHVGHAAMSAGQWAPAWGHDVWQKTLGIVGCGRIGLAVARRASGFNMRVLAFDPAPSDAAKKLGVEFVSLPELLAQSNFVSLHAALTPGNRGLIGEKELRAMKSDAYLINASRGALVDEIALVRALTEGWIAGAAVDAYIVEPLPLDHPLRHAPNVLLAPHQASFARDTGAKVSALCAQAILDLHAGRRPQFVLNPEVLTSPALRAKLHSHA